MNQLGFSLIELLVAMVILSILAAISLKITDARKRAYLAVLQSDLRNVATAQEVYYEESRNDPSGARYANNISDLNLVISPNVSLQMVGQKDAYTVRATHDKRTDFRCALYLGEIKAGIQPYEPAIEEGVIECEPKQNKGKGKGK
jgi:prepilin-type N-terminal cleavage/methylation domain-containing protein